IFRSVGIERGGFGAQDRHAGARRIEDIIFRNDFRLLPGHAHSPFLMESNRHCLNKSLFAKLEKMKKAKHILLHALPAPLAAALEEQLQPPLFVTARAAAADAAFDAAPDVVVAGPAAALPAGLDGRPVLRLDDGPVRLGAVLRRLAGALQN